MAPPKHPIPVEIDEGKLDKMATHFLPKTSGSSNMGNFLLISLSRKVKVRREGFVSSFCFLSSEFGLWVPKLVFGPGTVQRKVK